MAEKVDWSRRATHDLDAIAEYISRDSEAYAAGMIRRLLRSVENVAMFPRNGRRVPEYDREEIREVIARPHRVIYRIEASRVVVLTVVHGARLLPDNIEDSGRHP